MAAVLLPNGKQQFIDINGNPLVAGTVGMYVPTTLTPKNTWQDADEDVLNSNPIILDSRGQAVIYGTGTYRQIVKDSLGNLIWDKLTDAGSDTCGALGVTNVTCYGAKGNGSKDDTASIQAAIDAAPSGGIVYFPPTATAYIVSGTLTVSKPLTITGKGPITMTATNAALFESTASNVTFDGLTLNGAQSATYHALENAIYAHGTFNAGSAPTNVTNFTARNLTITGWGAAGIQANYITNVTITHNTISTLPYAGIVVLSCVFGDISGNTVQSISGTGVGGNNAYGILISREAADSGELTSQPRSARISVTDNKISGITSWVGIDTHAGINLTVANNVVRDTFYGLGIGSSKDSGGVNYVYAPLNVVVSGNVVTSTATDGSRGTGINFTGAPTDQGTGAIIGNMVQGYGTSTNAGDGGVLVYNTTGMVISGNTIKEPSPNGIYASVNNYGLTISGNAIIDVWTNSVPVGGVNGVVTPAANNNQLFIGDNSIRQVSKSATYLLNNSGGVAIRLGAGTGNATSLGLNFSNATTYLVDGNSNSTAKLQAINVYLPGLPTSAAGLPTGALWSNANVVTVVP